MSFTLWRGDRLLGALHLRASARSAARRHLSALLLPSDGAARDIGGVVQTRVDIFPGRPVLQHPLEPLVAAAEGGDVVCGGTRGRPVRLHPAGGAERQGVAPERQLQLRDETGRLRATRQLSLREFQPLPGTETEIMAGYPEAALQRGSVWLVDAVLDADEGVP